MLVDISVKKSAVYAEVAKQTAYLAGVLTEATYDGVAVTRYDHELLDTYWVQACDAAATVARQFLVHTANDMGAFVMKLALPGNFNAEYIEVTKGIVLSLLSNFIISRWLEPRHPDEAKRYAGQVEDDLLLLKSGIYARRAPIRYEPE